MITNELLSPTESEVDNYNEESYDDMLNSAYPEVTICGSTFSPAYALKKLDPAAYRFGFNDCKKTETVYSCPICGKEYDCNSEDEAKHCCQSDEIYECEYCGSSFDNKEDCEACEIECFNGLNDETQPNA